MTSRFGLRYRGHGFDNDGDCVCHSRRGFLAGVGAVGAAAALAPAAAKAEAADAAPRTVDVHHHIYPPRFSATMAR